MKAIIDVQVDETDDLIIQSDDLLVEDNILQSSLNVAGRRIVGRADDATFRENMCAGLERFLFSTNITNAVYDIRTAIVKALTRDSLFTANEFDIGVAKTDNPNEAKLYIIFKSPVLGKANTFKVFVDIENQRVYRG